MKLSFARVLYYAALVLVPLCIIGVAVFSAEPGVAGADTAMRAAHAAEPLAHLGGPHARKRWVCPMHPHIAQDHPGSCPICGMDLVEADGVHMAEGVPIDPAMQQRLGVRLARVAPRRLAREARTYGTVAVDEASVHAVSPKVEGWISRLQVKAVGERVAAGQLLYEIYSPELVQRQREYIELLQRRDQVLENLTDQPGQNAQVAASLARERLRMRDKFAYADVGAGTLAEIERTHRTVDRVPVFAPRSGYVTQIGAREGAYVTPMTPLLSLADNATVWIDIALYPDQLESVRAGDAVTVRFPRSGHPPLTGRLGFVLPTLDPVTRTARARIEVRNPDGRLRPGQFAEVVIAAQPRTVLAVPRSAVIRTGAGDHVMLARDGGHFMPVPVETGVESGGYVEIVDGLQEGAQVAVSGQFLLDAAASLDDAAQRMQAAP
ncbi:MAG: efflux RND transporter periplasmic adaptor subunit [Betaproteobacteria bacterium]|nr:efflux RND transporter periplasmic adaptor subunit [Betaproteobacteria bacterium]